MRFTLTRILFATIFVTTLSSTIHAEGTKQVWPSGLASEIVGIQFWDNADPDRQFATYGCNEKYRLNITVSHSAETIYFGFKEHSSTSGKGDLYFRILDSTGTVVYGPTLVPTSAGPGYIANWSEANLGPAGLTPGGYNHLSFNPGDVGTYYIEFNPDNANSPVSIENRRLEFFDITVANGTSVKDGRLHSCNWDFSCFSFSNRAYSKLFVYSNDGVVSRLDLNGIQPYGFEVQTNSTGPVNSGNPNTDRQSITGKAGYPDYLIFLNDPDSLNFPTGNFAGLGSGRPYMHGCSGSYCINVDYSSSGYAEILLDFNGNAINDSTDILLTKNVVSGYNCYTWDGLDGDGNTVAHGFSMATKSTILAGMTHYPIYDAENHTNGFIVDVIRPAGLPTPSLFYDDTQIGGGLELVGCGAPCHTWTGANVQTHNTWWFGLSIEENITLLNNQCSPTALNDTITGSEGQSLDIDVLNIGADFDNDGDDIWPNSAGTNGVDGFTYAGGTITRNDNGTPADSTDDYFVYDPAPGFSGLDSTYYVLYDAMLGMDTALIYIYVNGDSDGDGIADDVDIDSDNDGIIDAEEDAGTGFNPSADTDGDGIPNYLDASDATPGFPAWVDTNGDGTNDVYDTDMDGLADFIDLDADNDGIPDLVEAGGVDTNGDGVIDSSTDADMDGLWDQYDGNAGGVAISIPDSDQDGVPDYLDMDSDGDGITDCLEAGGTDADGDGMIDGFVDSDQDGLSDNVDGDVGNDGIAENSGSALQLTGTDTDGDGIPNSYPEGDTDGDGNLDQLDIDSDNDGILDIQEAQTDLGYIGPSGQDSDGDGIDDSYDTDSGNSGLTPVDTDGDGITDTKDLDSDNDSVSDLIEGHDDNADGIADTTPLGTDTDGDGLDDAFDISPIGSGNSTGSNAPIPDFDADNQNDWRDSDDDDDGIATQDENADIDNNGQPDYLEVSPCPVRTTCVSCASASGNADAQTNTGVGNPGNALGAPDGSYAAVNNGDHIVLDLTDTIPAGETVVITIARRQATGGPSRADIEQSIDGVVFSNVVGYTSTVSQPTYETVNYVITGSGARYIRITRTARGNALDGVSYDYSTGCIPDWDMDGIVDANDLDDDNDGISDIDEGNGLLDTDGDGIMDVYDLDSDNDGIPDAVEANGGTLPANMLEEGYYPSGFIADPTNDVTGDGWYESIEGGPAYSDLLATQIDSDGDGLADYIDLDADGDGITDAVEANGGVLPANMDDNGQYPATYASANDTDGDGLVDDIDPDQGNPMLANDDFDNDGIPNYLDLDSDADGLSDFEEGFNPDITLSGTDSDGDGNDDSYDPDSGNSAANLPDLNCNGLIDYLDGDFSSSTTGNFNVASTWSFGYVPALSNNIVVRNGHTITLVANTIIGSLDVQIGGTLDLAGFDLTVKGNMQIDGSLITAGSTVLFEGLCAQSLCGNIAFENLTIDNSNGVNVTCGEVVVNGVLDLESGVLDVCSATSFTLASNGSSGSTASIDADGTGSITCDITVERYKQGCKDGFLSVSTPFATNAAADWGDDLLITGLNGGPFPTFWKSLYYYDETASGSFETGWASPTHYTSDPLVRGRGYWMYAGVDDLPAKIKVTGTLDLSPFTFPLDFTNTGVQDEDGFNLLGNPYPTSIDWKSASGWTKNKCCDAVFVWNECVEQYASAALGTNTNGGSTVIESGQSFWIKAHATGASLSCDRGACTSGNGDFRSDPVSFGELRIHVDGFSQEDECVITLNNQSAHGHDISDADNMLSSSTMMAIYTVDGPLGFSINAFPYDGADKVIPVMLRVPTTGSYMLDFSGAPTLPQDVCVILRDNENGSLHDLKSTVFYNFTATAEAMPSNRFDIIFDYQSTVQPASISCYGANDGKLVFDPSNGVGPYNLVYRNSNGDTIGSASNIFVADSVVNLPKGTYTIDIEDEGSATCSFFTIEVEIKEPAKLMGLLNYTDISCDGSELGSIEILPTGGTAPYNFDWNISGSLGYQTNLSAGVYTCNVSDVNGCSKSFTIQLNQHPQVSAEFISSTYEVDLAVDSTINLTNLSTGHSGSGWNFGDGQFENTVNPSHTYDSTGTYLVTLSAYNDFCTSQDTATIVVVNSVNGIDEVSDEINAYTTSLMIVLDAEENGALNGTLQVISANGKQVAEKLIVNESRVEISTESFARGVYIIRLLSKEKSFEQKVNI